MITILLLSIAGAVIAAIVGTFWYSNATPMGKIHMQSLGYDRLSEAEMKQKMEEAKPKMAKMYAAQMFLSFLTSLVVVFIVLTSAKNGLSFPMALGFVVANWLCFIVPTTGSGVLWSNTDRNIVWKKFFSDIFSSLVTLMLIASLAELFV